MSERVRRILMALAGVTIAGLSVGLFRRSGLGIDPFQVFAHGVWHPFERLLDYGTFYMILNAVLLVVILFWNRRMIGIGTFINLFLVGYMADWSERMLTRAFPVLTLPGQLGLLLTGVVIMCFASALYFTADLGVSTYDAVALTISQRTQAVPFRYIRVLCDFICVLVGALITGRENINVGTIITAFFMGPLISFFNRTVAQPLRYGRAEQS